MEKQNISDLTVKSSVPQYVLFVSITILYFFSNFYKVVIPGPIFDELQMSFQCDASGITAISSTFMYVYGICQLIVGLTVDRYGGLRVMWIGGALMTVFGFACAFSPNLALMYVGRIFVGAGSATIYLSSVKEITRFFPNNFSVALGVFCLVGYSGSMFGNTPFIFFVEHTDWRFAVAVCAAISIVVYLFFLIFQIRVKKMDIQQNVRIDFRRFITVCKVKHNVHVMIVFNLAFGVYFAILTVLAKKYLEDFFCLNSKNAGYVVSAMVIFACFNGLITAFLSKHFLHDCRRPFIMFTGIGSFVSVLIQVVLLAFNYPCAWLGIVSLILITVAVNMTPIFASVYKETNNPNYFGALMSFSNFTAYIITAVLCTLMGWAMDLFQPEIVDGIKVYGRFSYLAVFSILLVLTALSFSFSFKVRETYGKTLHVD